MVPSPLSEIEAIREMGFFKTDGSDGLSLSFVEDGDECFPLELTNVLGLVQERQSTPRGWCGSVTVVTQEM